MFRKTEEDIPWTFILTWRINWGRHFNSTKRQGSTQSLVQNDVPAGARQAMTKQYSG